MQAATLIAPGQCRLQQVPIPQPGPKQVRVRLQGCGVCGSNLALWQGRPWFNYPQQPGQGGHEGWGYVEALGAGVAASWLSKRVALLSNHAFAEYDVTAAEQVVALPEELDALPFPGEALGCALNIFRRCKIHSGQTVAIVGIGFLGAVLTALCTQAGAKVLAISRRPFALKIARHQGAKETLEATPGADLVEQVHRLTAGRGCELVIEATGLQAPLTLAGELTSEGGRLIIAGYHQDGLREVNMQLWNWRGLDVINAHERRPEAYVEGIKQAVGAVVHKRLNPTPLYTHRYRLEQTSEAFTALQERPEGFLKALILL